MSQSQEMKISKTGVSYLDGMNYSTWNLKTMMILKTEGIWYTIEKPTPESPNNKWVGDNDKAMMKILISMHDGIMDVILGLTTAREIWSKLEADYGHVSLMEIMLMKSRIYNIKYTFGSMVEHINWLLAIVALLQGAGELFPGQDLIIALIASLPPSYESWIGGVLGQDIKNLTSDEFIRCLCEEADRRQVSDKRHDETVAMQVSQEKEISDKEFRSTEWRQTKEERDS